MEGDKYFYMELLRTYLDSTSDAIFVLCDEMKFLACNQEVERWLGRSEADLTQHNQRRPVTQLMSNNETMGLFIEYFKRAIKGHASRFECYLEPENAESRWVEIQLNKVLVESGDMVIVVARDISERKVAESELENFRLNLDRLVKERTAELERVNSELDAFSYSVSHDLRAPLRIINGFSDILLEDFSEQFSEEALPYLNKIYKTSVNMGLLIDDLLNLARAENVELDVVEFSFSDMANEVCQEYYSHSSQKNIRFNVQPELACLADRAQVRIVLNNLIGNAWKYSQKSREAEIEIGSIQGDEETVYYVRDNGCGFDMANSDKLFIAFKRLHGSEYEGTGVGLHTVKRIVVRHKGRIWAESRPSEGAIFYFTLNPG